MDIKEALDRSFGEGPPPPPIEATVLAGRAAQRRRRVVSGLAVCGLVAVAGGTAYGIAPRGGTDSIEPGVASSATSVPVSPAAPTERWLPGEVVRLLADGSLVVVRPGAVITRQVTNPAGLQPPSHSAGVEVRYQGKTRWYLIKWVPGTGSGFSSVPARQAFPSLQAWLVDQVAFERGDPTLALVRFDANGRLLPLPGVTIVEQRANPDLPRNFAPDGATTAVATVRWHGAVWYVLARRLPGATQPEYFPVAASVAGPTLDQFVDYARSRYAGGEGLR